MKNKTTIVIVAQVIIIIILIWIIVLLGNKNITGTQSDEDEADEEIIIDYTTVVNGIKQIQLPTSVEKNSNIQYEKLKKTQMMEGVLGEYLANLSKDFLRIFFFFGFIGTSQA